MASVRYCMTSVRYCMASGWYCVASVRYCMASVPYYVARRSATAYLSGPHLVVAHLTGRVPLATPDLPLTPPTTLPPQEFVQPGMATALHPYLELTQAVRGGDLVAFAQVGGRGGGGAWGPLHK